MKRFGGMGWVAACVVIATPGCGSATTLYTVSTAPDEGSSGGVEYALPRNEVLVTVTGQRSVLSRGRFYCLAPYVGLPTPRNDKGEPLCPALRTAPGEVSSAEPGSASGVPAQP